MVQTDDANGFPFSLFAVHITLGHRSEVSAFICIRKGICSIEISFHEIKNRRKVYVRMPECPLVAVVSNGVFFNNLFFF